VGTEHGSKRYDDSAIKVRRQREREPEREAWKQTNTTARTHIKKKKNPHSKGGPVGQEAHVLRQVVRTDNGSRPK